MRDHRQEAVMIEDEEGIEVFWDAPLLEQSTRYIPRSKAPSASPATLVAESPELDVQSFQRLSIEPSLRTASPANDRSTREAFNLRKRSRQVATVISGSDDEEVPNHRHRLSRPTPVSRDLRRENSGLDATDQDEIVSVLPSIEFGNDEVVIDLTAEDELEAAIIWDEEEAELRRLAASIKHEKYPIRNPAIELPLVEIERCCDWKGGILRSGKTIELVNGSFLRILVIVENVSTGEIRLRGWLLKRNTELDGLIPWQHNELCYIFEVDKNDSRLAREQCVEEVGLKEIAKIRRVLYTNQSYPAFNNYDELRERGKQAGERWRKWVEEQEVLVVRWKSSPTFRNAQHRMKVRKNPNSDHIIPKLEMLRQDECSTGKGVSAEELRFQFRGPTVLGGSHKEFAHQNQATSGPQGNSRARVQNRNIKPRLGPKTTFMSLEDDQEFVIREPGRRNPSQTNTAPSYQVQSQNRQRQQHSSQHNGARPTSRNGRLASTSPQNLQSRRAIQRYDFGDWFCCSGGASSGASPFLQLRFGIDKDAQSGESFRANFPKARFYEMAVQDVFDFLGDTDRFRVDVAHGSTVCKTVSKAKTRPCVHDVANRATLFTVKDMLLTSKPRIFTLEQADGFLNPKHTEVFNRVIRQYTSLGFSVTWQIVPLELWGLPQYRRRLIIIASCPGEDLPSFPPFTHDCNPSPNIKPLFTPKDALASIPRSATLQEPRGSKPNQEYAPWDARKLLNTITCSGTLCLPDGSRALTLREIASLAGFPWYHEFKGRGIRAQIGNAFPPVCAGVLFGHVVGHLKGVDGAAIAARAETGRAAGGPGSGCGFGRYSAEGKLC